jgi:hypothetical protein
MASSTDPHNPTINSVAGGLSFQLLYSAYQHRSEEILTKLRSNNFPKSSVERAHLRALIARTRSDLNLCSDIITRIQVLKTLELQESLLAPIRILPSEILTGIFDLVIRTGYPEISYISLPRKLRGTIFTFTWVCAWWRSEALSHPAFWSRIGINLPMGGPKVDVGPRVHVLKFMQECILRSGSRAPMDIMIDIAFGWMPSAHFNVLETLVNRANRWRTLKFYGYGTLDANLEFFDLFATQLASSSSKSLFPLLEESRIHLFLCDIDRTQSPLASLFYYIPPLQKLDARGL